MALRLSGLHNNSGAVLLRLSGLHNNSGAVLLRLSGLDNNPVHVGPVSVAPPGNAITARLTHAETARYFPD